MKILQKTEKKTKTKSNYVHIGGGCMLGIKAKYPCDDSYMNKQTRKVITVSTTKEAHFDMPKSVSGLVELLKIKGVKK